MIRHRKDLNHPPTAVLPLVGFRSFDRRDSSSKLSEQFTHYPWVGFFEVSDSKARGINKFSQLLSLAVVQFYSALSLGCIG